MSSATLELIEETTSTETNEEMTQEELEEILPPTYDAFEVMHQAGILIPEGISSEITSFWNVSL